MTTLRDFSDGFPKWPAKSLEKVVPGLCKEGYDLLSRMLTYDPAKRISCKEAMAHPYFADLDTTPYEK